MLVMNAEVEGPNLPQEFIKIIPHPHSLDSTPIIIPLNLSPDSPPSSVEATSPVFQPQSEPWPWAPFKTLADFEYTETAIQGLLSKALVNKQLSGLNSTWAVGSRLSIKNYNDMEKALAKARRHTVQVRAIQMLHMITNYIFQTVYERNSLWDLGRKHSFLYLRISRSMGMDPLACARRIISTGEYVEFGQKVLLLQ
jgi:hypothetical protein